MPLRVEQVRDHDAIASVVRTAFGGAHGDTVALLVGALRRDDPDVLSLVCEEADEVVGHVMFSRGLVDAPQRLVPVRSLSPLSVAPRWQRRGVGSALIHEGLRRLDERGVPLVFLEGDPAYYSRAGFTPAVDHGFRKPSLRIPDAAFQVLKLSAYEPWMTGTFVYSSAFWEFDCVGRREETT
ncbi:N-acetyltransferase [Asanoa ishikariensis]|uniref:Putative acetyltransferase n=1 Tax=Asanoa ishikariensis TaxID=137265 RepID=A0A1H3UHC6_9ACTN|nr:N-acetyltransferase [Asanoa ishikariensis]GIF63582.1 N-acetyltransferase [Asanoa ishikariensis]SDZ61481.1 putative acetyltransferase [Asanoa ishikariensis]